VEIRQRFVPFVEQVLQRYGTSAGAVVLVGHGGTYRCMLPLVLRNIDFRLSSEQGMGHTVVIVAELRPEGLVCVAWEDTVLGVPLCARLPNQGLEPTR
jgi:broad specificity phosphatase PhoE